MVQDFSPFWISLSTSIIATLITLVLGVLSAWLVAMHLKRTKGLVDGILTLPMILPPTVIGFILLYTFGRQGFIGSILEGIGISVIFDWKATVIAATVVSFPLMYKAARGAFEQIDPNILDAGRLLGASDMRLLFRVAIPLAWPGIAAGTVLAFARALGEFGATLMIAGNIPGKTQTMPIAIFFAAEGGDLQKAYIWVGFIFALSLSFMILLNFWNDYQKKSGNRGRG